MARVRLSVLLLAGVLAIGLAACGPTKLDMEKVKSNIQSKAQDDLSVGIQSVTCPEQVEIEAGSTFACTITSSDLAEPLDIEVTQSSDKGDFEWKAKYSVEAGSEIAGSLKEVVTKDFGIEIAVTCPGKVIYKVGSKITCSATTPIIPNQISFNLEMTSENGDFSWKSTPPSAAAADDFQNKFREQLRSEGYEATVTCPAWVFFTPGYPMTCQVVDDAGVTGRITGTMLDETGKFDGNLEWDVP